MANKLTFLSKVVAAAREYGSYNFEVQDGPSLQRFCIRREGDGVAYSAQALISGKWSSEYPVTTEVIYDAIGTMLEAVVRKYGS